MIDRLERVKGVLVSAVFDLSPNWNVNDQVSKASARIVGKKFREKSDLVIFDRFLDLENSKLKLFTVRKKLRQTKNEEMKNGESIDEERMTIFTEKFNIFPIITWSRLTQYIFHTSLCFDFTEILLNKWV